MSLAVVTPHLGEVSETFVRRHIEGLRPGRTIAIAGRDAGNWQATCPTFLLDGWALKLPVRLASRAGLDKARLRERAVRRFLDRHKVDTVLGEYLSFFLSSCRCSIG